MSYALYSTVCSVHASVLTVFSKVFENISFLNASMGITNVRDHHSPLLLGNLNHCPFHFGGKTFMNSH